MLRTIALQVLNLRTLKPIDREAIAATVKKTQRVVFTEEGWPQSGIGAEIIAIVNEEAFVRIPHLCYTSPYVFQYH